MQVTVYAPDGSTEVIYVGYDGDTAGMYENTVVTVYGTPLDSVTFSNSFGGSIS